MWKYKILEIVRIVSFKVKNKLEQILKMFNTKEGDWTQSWSLLSEQVQ